MMMFQYDEIIIYDIVVCIIECYPMCKYYYFYYIIEYNTIFSLLKNECISIVCCCRHDDIFYLSVLLL